MYLHANSPEKKDVKKATKIATISISFTLDNDMKKYISIIEIPTIGISAIKNENSAANLRSICK